MRMGTVLREGGGSKKGGMGIPVTCWRKMGREDDVVGCFGMSSR